MAVVAALLVAVGVVVLRDGGGPGPAAADRSVEAAARTASTAAVPPARHVFVINIENKGFQRTWGSASAAPYLARTLRAKGVLLRQYFGTAHNSQGNYVAQVTGQGPTPQMQSDCATFANFRQTGTASPGQLRGSGCVLPARTPSLPGQLDARGLGWKGYMQGMTRPCQHPAVGARDTTQRATATRMYAVKHNPFVYLHSVIDRPRSCARHVVQLSALRTDLGTVATTPHLAYVTPDLCSDGHDTPCKDGRPGGLRSIDAFMKVWVPRILASPAFRKDGVLVITADESDGPRTDATACCGLGPAPNAALPGITGPGGGRIGALVISRWTRGGTVSDTAYDHYSLLGSVEDLFGLPHLGYAAAPGHPRFGRDVWNSGWS